MLTKLQYSQEKSRRYAGRITAGKQSPSNKRARRSFVSIKTGLSNKNRKIRYPIQINKFTRQ